MRPALFRGRLVVARHHAHPLVDPRDDIVRRAPLQEGDAVLAAGCEDAVTGALHLRRKLTRDRTIAEGKTEVPRPDLGKAEARHSEDLLATGDAFRAFQLDTEQQLAFGIERPGIAAI